MRILFIALVLAGCSSVPHASREPAAVEELDPKFETYYKNDAAAEHAAVADVGRVIGSFVAREANVNRTWEVQQRELLAKPKRTRADETRLAALNTVLNDLPKTPGLATRDVHRKPHGCFDARVKFASVIPADLQRGLFQPGAEYDAVVRYSNGNPKNQHDFAPDARGMAVKLLDRGTLGQVTKPLELNARTRLDLLAINFPVFFVNDPATYAKVNQAFLVTSENPEAWVKHKFGEFLSVYLEGMDKWERELALNVNGSLISNPLSESYWSMMAFRLGSPRDPNRTAIKFKFKPCEQNGVNPAWTLNHDYAMPTKIWATEIPRATRARLDQPSERYYLRKVAYEALASEPRKCFDIQVQRFIDQDNTPIEDSTSIWLESPEQRKMWAEKFASNAGALHLIEKNARRDSIMSRQISEPITIARLEFAPVNKDVAAAVEAGASVNRYECDALSFNPWNNVPAEHKPLGIVGRMRRAAYEASHHTRETLNHPAAK